jgi:hypothetical protein
MVKISEERKVVNEEQKDISKTRADTYTAGSKMSDDSSIKLNKTWFESTEALLMF